MAGAFRVEEVYNIMYCLFNSKRYNQLFIFIDKISLNKEQTNIAIIFKALIFFLKDDLFQCKNTLLSISSLNECESSLEEIYQRYAIYLLELILFYENNKHLYKKEYYKELYLIGDSHCLSPAYTFVNINNTIYRCIPNLVQNTQARHLVGNNNYTSAFEYAVKDIPESSFVVMMFGEIGTRLDIGILPYHIKNKTLNKKAISLNIKTIIKSYVNFCIKKTKNKKLNLIFYGVPISTIKDSKYKSWQDYIIKKFNIELAKEVKKKDLLFIDVYEMTLLNNYHLDSVHLTPIAFAKACEHFMV